MNVCNRSVQKKIKFLEKIIKHEMDFHGFSQFNKKLFSELITFFFRN